MDIRRRLGLNIKAQREHRAWSQEELADQAGLHRTYISGVERGVRNPTLHRPSEGGRGAAGELRPAAGRDAQGAKVQDRALAGRRP